METSRDYPKEIIDDIFEDDRSRIKPVSALESLRNYEQHPYLRSSPTYEFLHFAVVSSLTVDDDKIDPGTLFMEDQEDNEHLHNFATELNITDVDIVDAKGKLFQTRIIIKAWIDQRGDSLNFCLCFGKVYDRADGFRAIAQIQLPQVGLSSTLIAEPGVAASFSDHSRLEKLPEILNNEQTLLRCDSQLTAILNLAIASVEFRGNHSPKKSQHAPRSTTRLVRAMLCLLTNPNSAANTDNNIIRTLCSSDIPQQTIAEFAGGLYPVVNGGYNDQLDWLLKDLYPLIRTVCLHDAGHLNHALLTNDQLEWLLKDLYPLIRTVRLHDAGNLNHAVLTFKLWVDDWIFETFLFNGKCYVKLFERIANVRGNYIDVLKTIMVDIDECIAFAKYHTLGLTENNNFLGWIQKHSKCVKEYESSFDRRVQNIGNDEEYEEFLY
eukprot:CAMPEP_0194448098 /NCGR_PEP_ID=MMETSP0176-20130528/129381_1 /TAXON_ID=216777 /ORGANISM="Proboscia alata, Strain PI-D3" /LENGTH=436 /DNA_ID=CAMNT_0039275037 /DNA_START=533 /DNA_END=1844 /DNA_ORIENTATION=-